LLIGQILSSLMFYLKRRKNQNRHQCSIQFIMMVNLA